MSLWNKILIGLVLVASAVFFYLGARMLKTHQYWRELAGDFETAIKKVEDRNRQLVEAEKLEDGRQGLTAARRELSKLLVSRGRAWYKCDVTFNRLAPDEKPSPESVEKLRQVKVTKTLIEVVPPWAKEPKVGDVVPYEIVPNMIVYAAEEKEAKEGGRYIGEFRVTAVDQKVTKYDEKTREVEITLTVQMVPTMPPDDRELQRIRTRGPWTLYERLPADRHDVFAGLTDDEIKALLTAAWAATTGPAPKDLDEAARAAWRRPPSLDEFLKDGKPENPKEPSKVYVRHLCDYRAVFRLHHLQRPVLEDLLASKTNDLELIKAALEDAKKHEEFENKNLALVKARRDRFRFERDEAEKHVAALQGKVRDLHEAVQQMIQDSLTKARRIAGIQREAARQIDERTRTMAQAGRGAN
jgi:hypothetical protein